MMLSMRKANAVVSTFRGRARQPKDQLTARVVGSGNRLLASDGSMDPQPDLHAIMAIALN